MSRQCQACAHPNRQRIDEALASDSLTVRAAAATWDIPYDSMWRHRARHLPLRLVQARTAVEVANAERLVDLVERVRVRSEVIMAQALDRNENDRRGALAAIRGQLTAIELLAKVSGHLRVTVEFTQSPEWASTRRSIVAALAPYPEALRAVRDLLKEAG